MRIAYYVSNRTTFPPQPGVVAATHTVVTNLINELSFKHEITLYAAQGSTLSGAKIIDLDLPPYEVGDPGFIPCWEKNSAFGNKQIFVNQIIQDSDNYDIIHFHTEPPYLAMPFASLVKTPLLFTAHCPFFESDRMIYEYYLDKVNFSALSEAQAKAYPTDREIPVIYNGIDNNNFKFEDAGKEYYLFLGRLISEKGADDFIELAKRMPDNKFIMAGSGTKEIEEAATKLEKDSINFKYIGLVENKSAEWFDLFSNAKAVICPVKIVDSCPLVPIEAMALGTPVLAYNMGAMGEEVEDEETGFLIENDEEKQNLGNLQLAVQKIGSLSSEEYSLMRKNSRKRAEQKFSAKVMAEKYEKLYQKIINSY